MDTEKVQHAILLAITAILFIIFATGLAMPSPLDVEAEVIV